SILYVRGERAEETIMSGILSLVQTNKVPITIIVFVASNLAPLVQIVVMLEQLIPVKFRIGQRRRWPSNRFRSANIIGRWSMLDLYVLALTVSPVDRVQILSFTPGPAALFFYADVSLTKLAAKRFDTRVIRDVLAKPTTPRNRTAAGQGKNPHPTQDTTAF
ncbi:paraquat-inducible protein A, partial [Plesiomonas shigelloides]